MRPRKYYAKNGYEFTRNSKCFEIVFMTTSAGGAPTSAVNRGCSSGAADELYHRPTSAARPAYLRLRLPPRIEPAPNNHQTDEKSQSSAAAAVFSLDSIRAAPRNSINWKFLIKLRTINKINGHTKYDRCALINKFQAENYRSSIVTGDAVSGLRWLSVAAAVVSTICRRIMRQSPAPPARPRRTKEAGEKEQGGDPERGKSSTIYCWHVGE